MRVSIASATWVAAAFAGSSAGATGLYASSEPEGATAQRWEVFE
jgi:hypothetical protein